MNETTVNYINDTTEYTTVGRITPLLRIVLSTITTTPVLINIFYVVVCFSALKRRFHYLLVLMLCIGDSILSLSLTMYSSTKLVEFMATNVKLCIFQTFCVCYGLVFTYTMVFWICTERYVVVKNYNFGVQEFFERFKLVIIGGTTALGFLFTIELVFFVPHEPVIKECTVPSLYGEQLDFFIKFIAGVLTGLMIGIIILCILTSKLIWQYFFKTTRVHHETNFSQSYSRMDKEMESLNENAEESSESVTSTNHTEIEISKKISQLVESWRLERMSFISENGARSKTREYPLVKRKFKPDAWERRAFVTTIVIAFSTIFLTGPFIFSFWLDYWYGARFTSQKVRLILFVPLVLNSMINPFIYAWRIQEIKQKIRKIFLCKN